jgi:putative transposase
VPLSSVISGANRHDMKLALATMDDIVIKCPKGVKQNMCMDKGYNFPQIERDVRKRGYADHTRHRRQGGCKEDTFCETVGGGENLIVAQQVPQAACKI